jgi:hypothetical protein
VTPEGIALHQNAIHAAVHLGQQMLGRQQGRVHAQLQPSGRRASGQQLDAVAQALGLAHVARLQPRMPSMGLGELHRGAEGMADSRLSLCAASTPSTSKAGSLSA